MRIRHAGEICHMNISLAIRDHRFYCVRSATLEKCSLYFLLSEQHHNSILQNRAVCLSEGYTIRRQISWQKDL